MPEGGCDLMGSPCWSKLQARTCGPVERGAHSGAGLSLHGGAMLEQPMPEGLCPTEGIMLKSSRTTAANSCTTAALENFVENYLQWERPQDGAGE